MLPELNAFGNYFRSHGYRLPLPEHGTTIFAIRYQLEYDKQPAPDSPRFTPGGILLGSGNLGAITAYLHYNFGAAGGPAATYLAFAATYNAHTQTLYRGGLFELPLAQSPGQRLDDLQGYGYYTAHVGLNNLPLSSPRWGVMAEKTIGNLRIDGVVAWSFYAGNGNWSARIGDAISVFNDANILSISWNAFLQRYLAVYSPPFSQNVVMRTSANPEGPWSDEIVAFVAMQPASGNVYDALAHVEYDSNGGQTIYVSYSRSTPAPFSSEVRLVAVEFQSSNAEP